MKPISIDDLQGKTVEVLKLQLFCAEYPAFESDPPSLLLKILLNDQTCTLRFTNISDLNLESFSAPFQIGGFQIECNQEKGWERSERYTVSDYENGTIRFFCETVEILES